MPTPIDPKVELDLSGTWTDISSYVRYDAGISISRGRSSEDSELPPSTASFKLNNTDGRFSPRNPMSPYYGVIGRNTSVRISLPYGETYLRLRDFRQVYDTAAYSGVTCPDAAALDITGDIDIRIDLTPLSWRTGYNDLCSKYVTTSDQRSWYLGMEDGYIVLGWSPDGTFASRITATSTAQVPAAFGRLALRATLDVNNGAAGYDVKFYTASTISGSWTQLGSTVTGSGVTSIYSSTATVTVGDVSGLSGEAVDGYYHAFQLLNGIGGTVVANPDFSIQTSGATSFADTASSPNTWTVSSEAYLSDRLYRFTGEVSTWPQKWDLTGTDVWVEVQASGVLRRLQQGRSPVQSALRRQLSTVSTNVKAYWPMEDNGADRFASAIAGKPSMWPIVSGIDAAADTDFVGSDALPTFTTGSYRGQVPYYAATGESMMRFLLKVPTGGFASAKRLMMASTTGTAARWDVWSTSTGNLHITVYDADDVSLATQNTGLACNGGELLLVSLELTQNGADIDYGLVILEQGAGSGSFNSYTLTTNTFGRIDYVYVGGQDGQDLGGTVIGHVSVHNAVASIFSDVAQFNGWGAYGTSKGENPTTRISRLSEENDLPHLYARSYGLSGNYTALGAQGVKTYLELVREAVAADLGLLFEQIDEVGIGYRSRVSLYNQVARLTLSYTGNELADTMLPTDDDQNVRNDITVSRPRGSSVRKSLDSGPLSTLDPPNGVGRYDEAVSINVGTDDQLDYQANWRLRLGTVDEARYPQIKIQLRHEPFESTTASRLAVLITDIGDRIVVTDLPAWLPPDDASQLVQGYSERFDQFTHEITFNCTPESPWHVAVYDTSRYDTAGSELTSGITSTATSVSVTTTLGQVWVQDAGEMPFDIKCGGERMTVTAVSGATSPQTFTVTRSVNGIIKAHDAATSLSLFDPAVYAL
jgi:hypothetical protein